MSRHSSFDLWPCNLKINRGHLLLSCTCVTSLMSHQKGVLNTRILIRQYLHFSNVSRKFTILLWPFYLSITNLLIGGYLCLQSSKEFFWCEPDNSQHTCTCQNPVWFDTWPFNLVTSKSIRVIYFLVGTHVWILFSKCLSTDCYTDGGAK